MNCLIKKKDLIQQIKVTFYPEKLILSHEYVSYTTDYKTVFLLISQFRVQ